MLVDLMVYDLPNAKGGSTQGNFEECIAEFMLDKYNVEDDMDSIEEMAKILMTIRQEFTKTAQESSSLWSEEFERIKLLN